MKAVLQNRIRFWKTQLPRVAAAALVIALAGCTGESPTEPEGEGGGEPSEGSVRLSSFSAAGSPAPGGGFSTEGVDPPGMPIVTVTRARFLVRNVELSAGGAREAVAAGPLVVELHLGGQITEMGLGTLPAGTYGQLHYELHRFDPEDPQDQQFASDPAFADFNTLTRPSMIIEGTVDDGTGAQPYVFESDDDVAQVKSLLASFELAGGQTANVTVAFDRRQWFPDGAGGNLDPRNPVNEQAISDNVKNSVSVYLDQERNGIPDAS